MTAVGGKILPFGFQELLEEAGVPGDADEEHFPFFLDEGRQYRVRDVTALTQAHGATYVAHKCGGVSKFEGDTPNAGPAFSWERDIDDDDNDHDDCDPHHGIAVAQGICFVSDICSDGATSCIVALDAADLRVRFKFGFEELRNPLGIAWLNGLLWVADGRSRSDSRLVAFSFDSPGPRVVHTISKLCMPIAVTAAHGDCLYVTCRDERSLHCFRPADYTVQGVASRFDSAPRTTLRCGAPVYGCAVHPELPIVIAMGRRQRGRPSLEVFWSRSVLGCGNYDLCTREDGARFYEDSEDGGVSSDDDDDDDDEEEEEDDDDGDEEVEN